jgi:hypothetical protein
MSISDDYPKILRRLKLQADAANEMYVKAYALFEEAMNNPIGAPGSDGALRLYKAAQELRAALALCRKAAERLAHFAKTGEELEELD